MVIATLPKVCQFRLGSEPTLRRAKTPQTCSSGRREPSQTTRLHRTPQPRCLQKTRTHSPSCARYLLPRIYCLFDGTCCLPAWLLGIVVVHPCIRRDEWLQSLTRSAVSLSSLAQPPSARPIEAHRNRSDERPYRPLPMRGVAASRR